jgi:lipopolysaccharide export system protein LptA
VGTSSKHERRRRSRSWTALALFGALAAQSMFARALPEDRDQPIYIRSDRAERDERVGTTVYTGDVEIDQGSMHISAERVTVKDADAAVVQIVAVGKPAKMHQKPSPEREPVYARALTIQYDVAEEVLTLIDDASVTQQDGAVNGDRIVYYTQEQRVVATGETSSASKDGRVNVVIQPPKRKADTPPANPQQDSGPGPR